MTKKLLLVFIFLGNFVFSQNNALSFSGSTFSGANVNLAYNSALNFHVTDKFTIECWAKTTASYAAIIWSNHVDMAPFAGHEMAIVNGKPVMDMTQDYISEGLRVESSTLVNDGNWHHLAFVYKGIPNLSGCEIFVDGVSQTLTANPNNLLPTSTTTVTNEVNIGSRNNTTYFSDITLDELRIWKRVLCASEIQANKNCSLNGNETQLEAYYKFNQGIASGNNIGVSTLIDSSPNAHTGTLTAFALNGSSSNWVASTAPVTGNCSNFSGGMTIAGNTAVCIGMSAALSASGALTYTWQPGNITSASANFTPSVSTTYTVYATNASGCLLVRTYSVSVLECTKVNQASKEDNQPIIYPNPNSGLLNIVFSSTGKKQIEIKDILGRLLIQMESEEKNVSIKLNDVKKGIYTLNIKSESETFDQKIIVE